MSDTTYEEATRCPKCGKPGNVRLKRVAKGARTRGAMLHMVYCENELCTWFDSCWSVQVNPDGTIPPPTDHSKSPKVYQGFELHDQEARDLMAVMKAQVKAEMEPGSEIRNPRG